MWRILTISFYLFGSIALFRTEIDAQHTSSKREEEPPNTREIPIEALKSLNPQKGFKQLVSTFEGKSQSSFNAVSKYNSGNGFLNAVVVSGEDFEQAMQQTENVLFRYHLCSPILHKTNDKCWVFVSLGSDLDYVRRLVEAPPKLDLASSRLDVIYETVARDLVNKELGGSIRGYSYWIPLGGLKPGDFELRMFAHDDPLRPTYTRRFTVRNFR